MRKFFFKKKHLALIASLGLSLSAQAAEVDLLLLYDDFTANRYNGNPLPAMTEWVENANVAYAESQVDIQLNLVGIERYAPRAPGMSARLREIRSSSEVAGLRNRHGADFVSLIASRDGNICGIGNLGVSARTAFNVTGVQCGYLTLIHELGHNMGLSHSRKQGNNSGSRYRYGLGYGVDRNFSTVMAYPQAFNSRRRLNRFSDPNRNCEGVPCGVQIGSSQEADAHTALNNVRNDIANFRQAVNNGGGNTPTPTQSPTASLPAPSGLSATGGSGSSLSLAWQDNSQGEDHFEIQRSTNQNSGFSRVSTVPRGTTRYVDDNLQSATQYFYRVRAHRSGVDSEWSNVDAATTAGNGATNPDPNPTSTLPAPSGLNVNMSTGGNVSLTWRDNSQGEDYFEVERSVGSNSAFESVGRLPRGNTRAVDQAVPQGQALYYRVRAHKGGVDSEWSNTSMITPVSGQGSGQSANALNLNELGFSPYTVEISEDAVAYVEANNVTMQMENNVWVASNSTFNIRPETVLRFDFSSNASGEIHGIGFENDDLASEHLIFQLAGSQDWGIRDFNYTGNGNVQSFEIPVGQYMTGEMKLVMANDDDLSSGHMSMFSNIEIINGDSTDTVSVNREGKPSFGISYVDENTAKLYQEASNNADASVALCVDGDCQTANYVNGQYEVDVSLVLGESYMIESKLESEGVSCSVATVVNFSEETQGMKGSICD